MNKKLPYFDKDGWLRNTKQFSAAAEHYTKHGRYTNEKIGSKEWLNFWREEEHRCVHGYKLGEIEITGYHYTYLNYYPMDIVQKVNNITTRVRRFPKFWFIDWQFFRIIDYCIKNGQHFIGAKVRGCGYSEKGAAMGARDVNLDFKDELDKPIHKKIYYYASSDNYLDPIVGKSFSAMDFMNGHTDGYFKKSYMLSNKPASYERTAGIITSTFDRIPSGGEVRGAVIDKADKVRGGRGNIIFLEESGAFKNFVDAVNIIRPLVELDAGKSVVGTIIAWGTSSVNESEVEGLKTAMYSPNGFNFVKFRNVWQPEGPITYEFVNSIPKDPLSFIIKKDSKEYRESGNGTGWFVPAYYVNEMDDDGNPMLKESLEFLVNRREEVLSGQNEASAMGYIADHPFTVEESLIKTVSREFNNYKLSKQIIDIQTGLIKPNITKGTFYPEMNRKDNTLSKVRFVPDKNGLMQLIQHPKWAVEQPDGSYVVDLATPTIKKLYIAGIDSIDQDESDSQTKGSKLGFLLKKRIDPDNPRDVYNNAYVCMYNERPQDIRTAYEQIGYALIYFDGLALLEYTKIALKKHFIDHKLVKYLAKEPDAPGQTIKNYVANTNKYGLRVTTEIINFYVQKIKDYLLDYADKVYFSAQLTQLSNYTKSKKRLFDLIAAMGMCEILEAELSGVMATSTVKVKKQFIAPTWRQINGRWVFGSNVMINEFGVDPTDTRIFDKETKTLIE